MVLPVANRVEVIKNSCLHAIDLAVHCVSDSLAVPLTEKRKLLKVGNPIQSRDFSKLPTEQAGHIQHLPRPFLLAPPVNDAGNDEPADDQRQKAEEKES